MLRYRFARFGLFALVLSLAWPGARCCLGQENVARGAASLHRAFLNPPDSSRIMVRWWWFGPAVTKPEITRELEQMKAAGIGGVELASLYALALDDPQTGMHNVPFVSQEHLEAIGFAAQRGAAAGASGGCDPGKRLAVWRPGDSGDGGGGQAEGGEGGRGGGRNFCAIAVRRLREKNCWRRS